MKGKRHIHFSEDRPSVFGLKAGSTPRTSRMKRNLLTTAVKVIPELFPTIASVMNSVSDKLTGKPFELFVFSDASPNAYCLGNTSSYPVLLVSSGLIERFDSQEIAFVVGHELGHAIFEHNSYPRPDDTEDPIKKQKILALYRAREITADRAGLVATGDTNAAFRAMMKLASGLSDKFIRFDVTAFLDQVKDLEKTGPSPSFLQSTHPFITSRIKCLLWYQMSDPWYRIKKIRGNPSLTREKLDSKVKKEIQ